MLVSTLNHNNLVTWDFCKRQFTQLSVCAKTFLIFIYIFQAFIKIKCTSIILIYCCNKINFFLGCAMAFMFIITIMVIAICRVHLKRTNLPRYPPQWNQGTQQRHDSWGNLFLHSAGTLCFSF